MNNKKLKYVYIIFLILSIFFLLTTIFVIVKMSIAKKNNLNSLNKTQIKNNFLRDDPKATINYTLINTLPDKSSRIYICGTNIKASNGSITALVYSKNNGKTWENDPYFDAIKNQPSPIINKIMAERYNDNKGLSDTLVVIGKYLPSTPSANNESLKYAGQIEYNNIFFAKINTTTNTVNNSKWVDLVARDALFDTDTDKIKNSKVINASIVKFTVVLNNTKKSIPQNHIYFAVNDEAVKVNNFEFVKKFEDLYIPKFYIYDLAIHYDGNSLNVKSNALIHMSEYFNTSDMYGKSSDHKTVTSKTLFDADQSSFIFKTGIENNSKSSTSFYRKTIIVERKHFDADNSNKDDIKPAHDKCDIFLVNYNYNSGEIDQLTTGIDFDNFKINSIVENPYSLDGTNTNNTTNPLIFGGQKNNAAYMISPIITDINTAKDSIQSPTFTNKIITNSDDGGYITNIIPFKVNHSTVDSKKETLPLVIIGNKINTKNLNLNDLNHGSTLTPNTKDMNNSSLLLASIEYNSDTNISSVSYSQVKYFENKENINFVDNSSNYSSVSTLSIDEPNYSYSFDCYVDLNLYPSSNIFYKISILKKGDNFEFVPKKETSNKNSKVRIIVPVVVIIIFIMLMIGLILYLKKKKVFDKYNDNPKWRKFSDKANKLLNYKGKVLGIFKKKTKILQLLGIKKK